MANTTVIIAHRRKGQDYWEGYTERAASEAQEHLAYFRKLGQIAKQFPSMFEYQNDCRKLLDKIEMKRKQQADKSASQELNVTALIHNLMDKQGWALQVQTSNGFILYKTFHAKFSGLFTYKVEINTEDNGGRCAPGAFIKCALYAPLTKATTGLVGRQKPVAEWKTVRGAYEGIPTAFTKSYRALQAKVGTLTYKK